MDFEAKSRVYVRTDDKDRVVQIEGEYSLTNCMVEVDTGEVDQFGLPITEQHIADGWTLIDEGEPCDKLNHAQNLYLDGGLMDERGIYRYKLVDGKPVLRDAEEMDADYAAIPVPAVPPTNEELAKENKELKSKLEAAIESNTMLEDCLAEMAEVVYA